MIRELLDLASGMQRTSLIFQAHQEAMESLVMETLQEYSGVINTHPGLVRLHEEAMEYYNNSKNKDSVSRPKLPLYFNKHVYTCMYICRRKLDPFFLPSSSPLPFLLSFYRKKKQRRFVNIVKPSTTSYSLSLTTSAITWWKILKR